MKSWQRSEQDGKPGWFIEGYDADPGWFISDEAISRNSRKETERMMGIGGQRGLPPLPEPVRYGDATEPGDVAPDTCPDCGCTLGTTVSTPIDYTLAFTALLELHPTYGQMGPEESTALRQRFLCDWLASGHTNMFGYAKEWIAANPPGPLVVEARQPKFGLPEPAPAPPYIPADVEFSQAALAAGTLSAEPSYGPNSDGNPYAQYTPEHRVWAVAQEHGKAAASWVFDGNTTRAQYRQALQWIRDGDPSMDELEPRSLRGDYTDEQLLADAQWVPHDGTDLREDLIAQYDTDTRAAFWHEVEKIARDQTEPVVQPDKLNDVMETGHVIQVKDGHRVAEPEGIHAPELYMETDDDGQILDEHEDDYRAQAERQGWQLLTSWTSQYSYRGLVMHPSEFVGGNLAEHILSAPGDYVVIPVETDDDSEESAGWAIAYRPEPEVDQ